MKLFDYMNLTYPALVLKDGLFYEWPLGIRFSLGDLNESQSEHNYMIQVYKRAEQIFTFLNKPSDRVYLVTNVDLINKINKVNVYKKYIKKSHQILNKLFVKQILYPYDDQNAPIRYQFSLECRVSDVKWKELIKAVCNKDMGKVKKIEHEVFFVNIDKKIIFQIYDDRGCDIITTSLEGLNDCYKRFNEWILDYDRAEIAKVFNS